MGFGGMGGADPAVDSLETPSRMKFNKKYIKNLDEIIFICEQLVRVKT